MITKEGYRERGRKVRTRQAEICELNTSVSGDENAGGTDAAVHLLAPQNEHEK